MRLRSIRESHPQDDPDSYEGDWPMFAYVPGMGDVYGYGIPVEELYQQCRNRLKPGEFFTWSGTIVRQLDGDYELDASIYDYVIAMNRAGFTTHSCDSAAPEDHPWLVMDGSLSDLGYVAFTVDEPHERAILDVTRSLGLACEHGKSYDADALVVWLPYTAWPEFTRRLVGAARTGQ